jgi:hypothetical protein
MSRSYKKPYYKVGMPGAKTIGARIERRTVRQLLKPWRVRYLPTIEASCFGCECREWGVPCDFERDPIGPELPVRKQLMDPYTVYDSIYHFPDDPKYYRK